MCFEIDKTGLYKIIILPINYLMPRCLIKNVYLYTCKDNDIIFLFDLPIYKKKPKATFRLRDQYYDGLDIMKGELYLWKKINHL